MSVSNLLETLEGELQQWEHQRLTSFDRAGEVRDTLFHYTSMAGLLGIIKNQTMWFTAFKHLNDTSELEFGLQCAYDLFAKVIAESNDPTIERFLNAVNHVVRRRDFSIYVASFSRTEDDLSQWRAYADNARGRRKLHLLPYCSNFIDTNDPLEMTAVARINYNKQDCASIMSDLTNKAMALFLSARLIPDTPDKHDFLKRLISVTAFQIIVHAISTKHPAYKNEVENPIALDGPNVRARSPRSISRSRAEPCSVYC